MRIEEKLLVIGIVAALVLMAVLVFAPGRGHAPTEGAVAGEPRDVDLDLLRRRIIEGELSDREALYYHRD